MDFVEVLLDEYPVLRITRVGTWIHCLDYETGEGDWYHTSEHERMEDEKGIAHVEDLRKKRTA